ncbi:MAG: HAMP domain-containing histidine kinase [Synechococcales cyanobacterium C42_A2020_086]|jgi:K+-sensing histidine kinase KdpD|nr:HAMP domain-containing histidine kinase [Synechococcales cyanobacterium C42_A2020_086]
MSWTHWTLLGLGFVSGGGIGWWWGRSAALASLSSVLTPDPNPAPPPDPVIDDSLKTELQYTRLAYEMAKQSEQFKAGFLARTSHELRSPINSVISLHQLILADLCDSPDEERDFIRQSYDAAQKMLGLLDQLIAVSKATYGTEQLQIQPVALEDVLMEVQSLTYLQAQNRGQRLELEYPDPDLYVLADPRWLRQAVVNLVDTPIGLMQEGSVRLTVQTNEAAQQVHIQIDDQRPASFWSEPLDLLSLLRSQEGDLATIRAATETPLPSPALSLLVSQTLIELMGGQLEVLAVPQFEADLTCIRCTLPLATAD